MKDQNDTKTQEIFKPKNYLNPSKGAFQRLHIRKVTRGGKSPKSTISIEHLIYQLLACRLKETPYTREANKAIGAWIRMKMNSDPAYDPDDMGLFSTWLKRVITEKIVSKQLREKVYQEHIEREKALGIED